MSDFDPTELNPSTSTEASRTTNKAGGVGYEMDSPQYRLYKLVLNNFLEDAYYEDANESFARIVDAVDACAREDPEFILQLAQYARHEEGLRDVSQVLLVLASNWGTNELAVDPAIPTSWTGSGYEDEQSPTQEYVREYGRWIMDRMDELNTVISLQKTLFDSHRPNCLDDEIENALHRKYVVVEMENPETGDIETQRFVFTKETEDDGETETAAFLMGVSEGPFPEDMDIGEIPKHLDILDSGYVFDEYTAAKYAERAREVRLHDVVNLVRPEPRDENRNGLFRKITYGELDETSSYEEHNLPANDVAKRHWSKGSPISVENVDPLRNERTWEAERSSDTTTVEIDIENVESFPERRSEGIVTAVIQKGGIDVDVDGEGELVDVNHSHESGTVTIEVDLDEDAEWRHRLEDMGIFARLRNLRNMLEAGLDGEEIFSYDGGTFGETSTRVVRESHLNPFRYYQAYRACKLANTASYGTGSVSKALRIGTNTGLLDATCAEWLESAIDVACENLPDTLEGTFVAVDLSGSMFNSLSVDSEMDYVEIGALFGAMMAKRGGDIGVFGETFSPVDVADGMSTLEIANELIELDVGHSTNGWKALEYLTAEGKRYDRVVFFTDEQIWDSTGWGEERSLKSEWDSYSRFHPPTTCYMVDLASYGVPSFPEGYSNVIHISGWSDAVFDYIEGYESAESMVAEIEAITPLPR